MPGDPVEQAISDGDSVEVAESAAESMSEPVHRPRRAIAPRQAGTQVLAIWVALAGAVVGALITGVATYAAQLGAQTAQGKEQRAAEMRQQRTTAYKQLLEAAAHVSQVADEIYQRCPNDRTADGCNGDTSDMKAARRQFTAAFGEVYIYGSAEAFTAAQHLEESLPHASVDYCALTSVFPAPAPGGVVQPATAVFHAVPVMFLPSCRREGSPGDMLKTQPDAQAYQKAYDEFAHVMSCDVLPQPRQSCLPTSRPA